MNWSKALTLTNILLFLLLLGGFFYFNNKINERQEVLDNILTVVIDKYQLNSCTCGMQDGGTFGFNRETATIQKVGSGSKVIVYNASELEKIMGGQ